MYIMNEDVLKRLVGFEVVVLVYIETLYHKRMFKLQSGFGNKNIRYKRSNLHNNHNDIGEAKEEEAFTYLTLL